MPKPFPYNVPTPESVKYKRPSALPLAFNPQLDYARQPRPAPARPIPYYARPEGAMPPPALYPDIKAWVNSQPQPMSPADFFRLDRSITFTPPGVTSSTSPRQSGSGGGGGGGSSSGGGGAAPAPVSPLGINAGDGTSFWNESPEVIAMFQSVWGADAEARWLAERNQYLSGQGGGESTPAFRDAYTVEGAPSWWKGRVMAEHNPEHIYANLMNSLIPFMSPEDQRSAASNLSRLLPDAFGDYDLEKLPAFTPPVLDTTLRNQMLSAGRAQAALDTLSKVAQATGKSEAELGPGYSFLRDVAATVKQFGGSGSEPMLKQQQLQLQAALDPLFAEAKNENVAAFGPLARMLAQPFYSSGQLFTGGRSKSGQPFFGLPNPQFS